MRKGNSKQNIERKNEISDGEKSKADNDGKTIEEKSFDPSYAEKKVESIFNFVKSPTHKLYVLFLKYTVKLFDEIHVLPTL